MKHQTKNVENSSSRSARCQAAICGPGLHLEALFDSISEGILTLDDDMRVTRANRAAAEILRVYPKEIIGRHCAEVLSGRGGSGGCTVCEALERKRHLDDERMMIIAKEGDRRTVRLSTSPLRNPERGRNEGYAVVLRDVTELEGLRRELQGRYRFHRLIGKSRKMREVFRLVEQAADSDATVVVEGESGTGKELAARALHYNSHRVGGPFVPVHCAALAEGVLESELFGHVKGAFTGATSEKKGRFEAAEGGTLFLDEVGEISPLIQLKLLRVLQEREIQRVGSNESVKVDVRIVAATNSRLNKLVSQGKFRQDLFYRLRVVAITIPSLRERREDIPLLVNHFVDKYREKTGKPIKDCQEAVTRLFLSYDWPGNVREMENAIERAFVVAVGTRITLEDLPPEVAGSETGKAAESRREIRSAGSEDEREREMLIEALRETGWNKTRAARRLGIARNTLYAKMKRCGIPKLPPVNFS